MSKSFVKIFDAVQTNPFRLADNGFYTKPVFTDLHGDGDLDILFIDVTGVFFYYLDTAAVESDSKYHVAQQNSFGLVDIVFLSNFSFADLAGDGCLYLLVVDVNFWLNRQK